MSRQTWLPFVLDIYSSAFGYLDTVAAPIWVTASLRWAGVDTASFAVAQDSHLNTLLEQRGRRMVVRYRPDAGVPDSIDLLSGVVSTRLGETVGMGMTRTYYVTGDFTLLGQTLGWPNPTGNESQQGDDDAYYEVIGPAETVALTLLDVNKVRQKTPITVAASAGRGASVSVRTRMHKLSDKIFPLVSQAGVALRLIQDGTSVRASGYVGTTNTEPLTEASGVVVRGSYTLQAPTATRAMVGGPGEGIARKWRLVKDVAAEDLWGQSWEVQVDARDVDAEDPDWAAKMDARGWEALTAGAATATVNVELSETEDFRFPKYNIGDMYPVQFADGTIISDRITRIDLSLTPTDGLEITPYLGNIESSTEARVMTAVSNIARSVRDLKVGF